MNLARYRTVLRQPGVLPLLLFGTLFRVPFLATTVVLTLHVVGSLHRSYGEAGLLLTAATVASAIGQPRRGRAIDRTGLRRALLPSLIATAAMYSVAPFLDYWWLLGVVAIAGMWPLPVFTAMRQSLSARVGAEQRRTAYALDSIGVEISFMAGPALGVWIATTWSTVTALIALGSSVFVAGLALLIYDPPTMPLAIERGPARPHQRLRWSPSLVLVLLAGVSATMVLAGTDVAIVAFARDRGELQLTSAVFVAWSVGSIGGALLYGALPRKVPPLWLLAGLGLLTIPVGVAPDTRWMLLTILPGAMACAPIITATADAVADLVDDEVLGEATGWHGAAMTGGSALGAPLAGFAADHWGAWSGFAVVGVVGLGIAAVGLLLTAPGSLLARPIGSGRLQG